MQIHNSNSSDSTPKPSGCQLGIYIPIWSAYAPQQGSCDAVPLLCGGLAVQGARALTAWAPAYCQAPMEDKYGSLDNTNKHTDRRPMELYVYEPSILVMQECTVLGYWEHGHRD